MIEKLTPREREVASLIARGFQTKEIAQGLGVSPKTIEAHRCNLYRKLGVHKASEVTLVMTHGKTIEEIRSI